MGSVYLRHRRWWGRYKDLTGRWRSISLKVDTKTQAKLFIRELEQKIQRQRLGLERAHKPQFITFGEVMKRWWAETEPLLQSKTIQRFAEKHLLSTFGDVVLGDITSGDLDTLLNKKASELAPQSLNHLRSYVRRVFNYADEKDLWKGPNPASKTKKFGIPETNPDYLRPHEIGKVLHTLAPKWRPLFATAIFTGMRKGELLALKKIDVDLEARTIIVRRSHEHDETKGKKDAVVPIADELVVHLERALKQSASGLVFPKADGTQQPRDLALHRILRRAMGRAGLVSGYRHRCRRKGCGYSEERADAVNSTCPKCSMKLWVSAIPRPIRFHSTRHTTATLLLKAKVPLAAVSRGAAGVAAQRPQHHRQRLRAPRYRRHASGGERVGHSSRPASQTGRRR